MSRNRKHDLPWCACRQPMAARSVCCHRCWSALPPALRVGFKSAAAKPLDERLELLTKAIEAIRFWIRENIGDRPPDQRQLF